MTTMVQMGNRATERPGKAGAGFLADQLAPVSFTVPLPPSTNALFKNVPGKGRVKTAKYDDYIRHAVTSIRLQRVRSLDGNVLAIFGIERPNAGSDLDNRLKGLIDAIVKAVVISDDKLISAIAVSWLPPANGLAHVILMPVQPVGIEFHPARNAAGGSWIIAASTSEGEASW